MVYLFTTSLWGQGFERENSGFVPPFVHLSSGDYQLTSKTAIKIVIFTGRMSKFTFNCRSNFGQILTLSFNGNFVTFENSQVEILAKSLRSWLITANEVLLETVKAEQYPIITVDVVSLDFFSAKECRMALSLDLAGVKKDFVVDLDWKINMLSGNLELKGKLASFLSDFSLIPPVLFDGAVQAHNNFDILFNIVLCKK